MKNRRARPRPDILLILLDDIGFGDVSTFGGVVATPALDKLAARGVRYTNFNTAAMCSPTRAALLTGRNHHRVGFGFLAESSSELPGYDGLWKPETSSIAKILQREGYATGAFGKWHNTPPTETGPAGPFDRWPTALGFDDFYGFQGWGTSQWQPDLFRGTAAVEAPDRDGYHLTADLADEAISWLRGHRQAEQPCFLYLATGAAHGPHHVPASWITPYRGRFDAGWDSLREETFARQLAQGIIPPETKLTARPEEIPAWETLTPERRRLLSRQMEIYAGFVAHTDYEVGRLIDVAVEGPRGKDTLVIYIVGDNGAAGEGGLDGQMDRHPNPAASLEEQLQHLEELGGPERDNLYSGGWAWAGSTPFQWFKSVASHFGATRNPMVVSWPAGVSEVGVTRTQFSHVTDVAPTIYDVTGIVPPDDVDGITQQSLDGMSLVPTFSDPDAVTGHRIQYFEILGNRAIFSDGWIACARHWTPAWEVDPGDDFTDSWELYDVNSDFSEAENLAERFPEKLTELIGLFTAEAERNQVLPLGSQSIQTTGSGRSRLVFLPDVPRMPTRAVAGSIESGLSISARLVLGSAPASGVIVSYGGAWEGFALYVVDGLLVFDNHIENQRRDRLTSDRRLPVGPATVGIEFTVDAGSTPGNAHHGDLAMRIDGEVVARGTTSFKPSLYYGSLGVGQAFGPSVSPDITPPFPFSGVLAEVVIDYR